jgi:hypothetical protein
MTEVEPAAAIRGGTPRFALAAELVETPAKTKQIVNDAPKYRDDELILNALVRTFAMAQYDAGAKTPFEFIREFDLFTGWDRKQ